MTVSTASMSSSVSASQQAVVPAQKYRREFDGLRAVASLAVVMVHAGFIPNGGGVDIFFVLSGYLITGNILRSLARGNFNFLDFYARRVRRIFPPLIIMMVTVLIFGWLVLLPDEFERLGKYIASGAIFAVNIVWNFDTLPPYVTGFPPIMHIWSLGVEEQFYLFWPVLLLATWKFGNRLSVLITSLAVVAFALFVIKWPLDQRQDLFLPWMYYLACGSALACIQIQSAPALKGLRTLFPSTPMSWLSLSGAHVQGIVAALLLTAWFTHFNNRTSGWGVLAPSIGTLLLITAGPQSWINRYVLGSSPVVFVGRISYQLYLWHFPLLFVRYIVDTNWLVSSFVMTMIEIAVSVVLAYLTYRYIELPLRSSQHVRGLAAALSLAMAALGCAGYLVFVRQLPARPQPPGVVAFLSATKEDWLPGTSNTVWTAAASEDFLSVGQGAHHVLFMGDSNMQQYYPRIAKLIADHPRNTHRAIFATRDSCAPGAVEIAQLGETMRSVCEAYLRKAVELAKSDPNLETVVIAGCWYQYFVAVNDIDHFGSPGSLKPDTALALASLRRLVTDLVRSGKRVYIVLSSPTGIDFDPRRMVRRTVVASGFKVVVRSPDRTQVASAVDPIDSKLRDLARKSGAQVVEPMRWLCNAESCPAVSLRGEPMYHDMYNLRPSYVRDNVRFLDATVLDLQPNGGS